jgi:hypothetical protein
MLRDILESLFRRPVTRQYPFERKAAPPPPRQAEWDRPNAPARPALNCLSDALELVVHDKDQTFVMLQRRPLHLLPNAQNCHSIACMSSTD